MNNFKPGMYQIPEAQYFPIKAVSSSLLKQMRKSPAHALAYLNRPADEDETDALRLGKIIDRAILEPQRLKTLAVKPKDMSFSTKEGKAWREAQGSAEIIKHAEYEAVKGIVQNVWAHPDVSAILKAPGKAQPSLFAIDDETGLPLKARLDWLSEGNAIVDIKSTTTADPALHGFPREIAKYDYALQAAFYLDMTARLGIAKDSFVFVAVEKEPPYAVTAIQLDYASVAKGRDDYKYLLGRYKECEATKSFPAYSQKIELVTVPDWYLKRKPYESAVAYELETV